jgi:hypothetical protein
MARTKMSYIFSLDGMQIQMLGLTKKNTIVKPKNLFIEK